MKKIGIEEIFSAIVLEEGRFTGRWKGLSLESVYQPIFGLSQKKAIGYEALVRGHDEHGHDYSPGKIFSLASDVDDLIFLDRLLRAIHMKNFTPLRSMPVWLFLNVDPTVAVDGWKYGTYFEDLLIETGFSGSQIVVEVIENNIAEQVNLEASANKYRSLGCLVAVDDFGAGHSNFDRIWLMKPEIVKLDRTMLVQASRRKDIRRIMPQIVSLIRSSGSLCLMEGVETEEEFVLTLETEIDFVQGYYFARPEPLTLSSRPSEFSKLLSKDRAIGARHIEPIDMRSIKASFEEVVRYTPHSRIQESLMPLFGIYKIIVRFFVLDLYGCQVGETWERGSRTNHDQRFLPITGSANTEWSHRAYFREAVNHVGRTYLSAPYLSTTGAHICRTISLAVEKDGDLQVYCLDIDWEV